ncbi:hypothetical protein [Pedobacter arcticus]|uniref:hypothetical protein n=1 Tax=Pedobacter arcticus TaxID=752140 RepID=UPI0002F85B37|nr:hypothetical protein [Pedobacter arcticus]
MENLSIGVEFPIENDKFKTDAAVSERIATGVGDTVEAQTKRVANKINELSKSYANQNGLIEEQNTYLKELNQLKDKSNDVTAIARYNRRIEETTEKLNQLKNAGRVGFDEFGNKEAIALEKPIGKLNRLIALQKYYAQASAKSSDPKFIEQYNRKLQETEVQITRTKNVGKKGFDELGNAIKGSTNYLGKAWGAVRQLAYLLPGFGVAGILAFASEPIIKYIVSLDLLGLKLSDTEQAQKDLADKMGQAGEASGKATIEIDLQKQAFEQARKGVITKTEALKLYNDKIGKTLGFTNDINVAEERTIKNGDAYIQLMFKKAKAAALLSLYQEQIAEQAKVDAKSDDDAGGYINSGLKNGGAGAQALFKKAAQGNRDREKAPFVAKAKAFEKLILETDNDIKNFAKKNSLSFDELTNPDKDGKKFASAAAQALKAMAALQTRVDDLNAGANRKTLTKNEEEIQAIKDKFKKISDEVTKFNADPKNKFKVDGSKLKGAEDGAIADATYQQKTVAIKTELDKQKQLYTDYEAYKLEFGKEKANERYKDEIDVTKTYLQKVQDLQKQFDGKTLNGGEKDRKKIIDDVADATAKNEKDKRDKDFADALKASETYEIKKQAIADKYAKLKGDLLTLPADEYAKRAAVLDEALKAENDKLNDDQIKKLKVFEPLFSGFEELSRKSAKEVIKSLTTVLNGMVKTGDISKEYADQIKKALKATDKSVTDKFYTGIEKAATAVGQMAGFASDFNGQLGDSLGLLANVLSNVKQVGTSLKDYQKAKDDGDTGGQITAGLGIVGAAFSVGKAVVGYFKNLKAAAAAARAEQKKFYDDAIKGEREYQALLRSRERESAKAQADRISGLQKEYALLKSQSGDIQKEYDTIMRKLQKEQSITGSEYKHGTWVRKAKTTYSYDSLAGKDYNQLEQLYTQGKLTAGAKDLFEQLKKLKEEGGDVAAALEDVAKQAAEIFTGTTADALTDSIVQMFKDGKTSAQDFADFFEDVMSDAALSIFKDNVLKSSMQDFYKKFAEDAQSGGVLDATEKENLKALFLKLGEDAKKQFDDLQSITGTKIGGADPNSNPNTIRGNVQNITANQADVLSGNIGGMRLAVIESNGIQREGFGKIALSGSEQLAMLKTQHLTQMEIASNTLRTANNTDRLKAIEEGITKMANSSNGVRAVGGP